MKKTTTTTRIIVLSIVTTLVLGTQVLAQRGGRPQRGPRMGQGMGEFQGGGPRCLQGGPGRGPGQGLRMGQGPGQGPMIGRALRQLDLTEEQRDEIHTIMEDNAEGAQASQEAIREAHRALQDVVVSEGDEAAISAAATQLANAFGEQARIRIQSHKKIQAVLTEEQRAQLAEFKEKARAAREAWQAGGEEDGPRFGPGRRGGQMGPGNGRRGGPRDGRGPRW